MPSNIISNILEIDDIDVKEVKQTTTETHIYFKLHKRPHTCPHCQSITEKVHDYRESVIKDTPLLGKKVFLHYSKRRYNCECCGKHFLEKCSLVSRQCRITTRLCFHVINLLKGQQSVKNTANQTGVSSSTIFRRMKDISIPKPKHLPLVLSIDEFRGNANHEKFQAILTDPKNKTITDILPDRSSKTLWNYFKTFDNCKDVRYFVMDMNYAYKEIAKQCFPNATIVIDKFHVVRYVNWALENVRKRVQKQMHPSKRKYFKRSRKLLLCRYRKLSQENKQAVEVMINQSPDLAYAYYLKEMFYSFIDASTKEEARKKMRDFVISAQNSELKEFKACTTMLTNWGKYILNMFECEYSNGFTEGCNNKIKVIKRIAYGYRNFINFRNRILLTL